VATFDNAVMTAVEADEGGRSRLRSPLLRGLMSIQSRSPSSMLGTVESAPIEMFTIDARSSKASCEAARSPIMSIFGSPLAGLDEVTSLCCEAAVVDTVVLLLLPLLRLMDSVVVDEMDDPEDDDSEHRLRSVIPLLLLLLDDNTGSMVREEQRETVVRAAEAV
jgi:hypothetical protein